MLNKKRSLFFATMLIIIGLVMGFVISSSLNLQSVAHTQESKISKESIDILTKAGEAMSEVVAAVKPAVVNISSTRTIKMQGMPSPFFDDPFFRRFFGDEFGQSNKPREHKEAGLGSGVIVDKRGYILTNSHVVMNADEIKVKLADKREFKGKVVGIDQKTDLAVIKIESENLPVIRLGDSDKLKVGETVIAIGNPFGLNQTVTSGIVSATGRANVGIADYEDFIQTDAPINPGNSGGALVNVRGEIVGINTAIFSTSGGYQGIGFAIPSNMAKVVMESLIKSGKVVRGWFGVTIQMITPDIAKHFNLKDEKGVLVGDVVPDSPADKGGIQRGDVIIEFNGKEIKDPTSLRNMVARISPNTEVAVKVLRDGNPKTLKATIVETPSEMQRQSGATFDNLLKGVNVQDLIPEVKERLNIPKRVNGVIITSIENGSPAEFALMKNDIIMQINKKAVNNTQDYESVVSRIKSGEDALLLVYRNGSTVYITLSSK